MRIDRSRPLSFAAALIAAAATLASIAPAYALPVGNANDRRENLREELSFEELEAAGVDFTAIIALSNCSGSLVRYTTSKTSDKALVLTNGHCVGGFIPAGDAISHEWSLRSFTLLSSTGKSLGTLRADQLVYGTMTGTDMALYRLNQTYAQITSKYGVGALVISDKHPTAASPVRIVSGYWKKIYACEIDKFVHELREGSWTWNDSIRFTQPGCETIGGTSGSPIIHADTREVIGINNTGNEDGAKCTVNNPCEVDTAGAVTYEKGAAYGQQLYHIYTCLSSTNDIDLNRTGCQLNKPK